MIGRAGRLGHSDSGESYLLCYRNEGMTARNIIKSELQPVASPLVGEKRGITSLLLEV